MRIFSYIFTALVTIFVINIALSFSLPAYRSALLNVRQNVFPNIKSSLPEQKDPVKSDETTRLVESLDRIDKHIESLTDVKKTSTLTGTTLSASGIPVVEQLPPDNTGVILDIPLSGIFLAKIMPDITPKKVENA